MLAHRYDPFIHRLYLCGFAGTLQSAVIRHNAVLTVKGFFIREKVNIVFDKVIVSVLVCDHIYGIRENTLDCKTGECFTTLCLIASLHQKLIRFRE